MSIYLNKMSDIINYWQAFLQEPTRLYQYQAYYNDAINKTLTKLDIDVNLGGTDNPKDNHVHIRYDQDLLVPNAQAIYGKHPQDIDNVTIENYKSEYIYKPEYIDTSVTITYYTIPVRETLERNKKWNLKFLSGESKHRLNRTRWNKGRAVVPFAYTLSSIKQAYNVVKSNLTQPITYYDKPYSYTDAKEYKGNILFPYPTETFTSREILDLVKSGDYNQITWDLTLDIRPKTYTFFVEEAPLEVPKLKHKYIKINGISFNSLDLALLYNTFLLETLVATQEPEINLPLMPLKDVKLLKDVFTGHTPLNYAYIHFSDYTYRQLSGDRTMLNIYELILARREIDRIFDLGLPLRIQLASIKLRWPLAPRSFSEGPETQIKISRLKELINLSSELTPNELWMLHYIF